MHHHVATLILHPSCTDWHPAVLYYPCLIPGGVPKLNCTTPSWYWKLLHVASLPVVLTLSCMPLDHSVSGEEWGWRLPALPHLNKTFCIRYVMTSPLNLVVKLKAPWRWASNEAAGVDTVEVVVADLHTSGSGLMVTFVLLKQQRTRRLPECLSSPI